MPIEFIMYLLVPIICKAGKRAKGKCIIFITGIVCIFSIIWQVHFSSVRIVFYSVDLGSALSIVPYYLLGIMISILEINDKYFNLTLASAIVIVCSALHISSLIIRNLLSFVLFPYVVLSIAYGNQCKVTKLFDKWDVSYGIFLYGFLVQQFMVHICRIKGISLSFISMLIICWVFTFGFAFISFQFIEKPIAKLSKKIIVHRERERM